MTFSCTALVGSIRETCLKDNLGLEHQCSTNNAFVHTEAMFPNHKPVRISPSEGEEKQLWVQRDPGGQVIPLV